MECKNCGKDNGDCRKTCCVCGKTLEGYTINNVTGEYGYRGGDGLFYRSQEDYLNRHNKVESKISKQPVGVKSFKIEEIKENEQMLANINHLMDSSLLRPDENRIKHTVMIKPNELRLGNYVAVKNHSNEVIGKVAAISKDLVSVEGGNNNYDYHLLKPIPVTRELLIKLGFEKYHDGFGPGGYFLGKNEDGDEEFILYEINDGIYANRHAAINATYLHELQNIYWMTEGKELEVKL